MKINEPLRARVLRFHELRKTLEGLLWTHDQLRPEMHVFRKIRLGQREYQILKDAYGVLPDGLNLHAIPVEFTKDSALIQIMSSVYGKRMLDSEP